jgi:predicted nucleic acid-binding protein
MSAEFIDSNVFVYLFDETDQRKRGIADALIGQALETGRGHISFQVVQETLNVITRKLATPVTPQDARRFLDRVLAPLWRVMPSLALYHRALDIQARHRYGLYDALIIAAALEAGCGRLFSEDLQHGQRVETLTIEDPFLA